MMYEELISRLNRYTESCVANKLDADFAEAVQQATDAIEELTDRNVGKWTDPADLICYKCTACGMYANQGYGLDEPIFWDYCPNCGAKMEN